MRISEPPSNFRLAPFGSVCLPRALPPSIWPSFIVNVCTFGQMNFVEEILFHSNPSSASRSSLWFIRCWCGSLWWISTDLIHLQTFSFFLSFFFFFFFFFFFSFLLLLLLLIFNSDKYSTWFCFMGIHLCIQRLRSNRDSNQMLCGPSSEIEIEIPILAWLRLPPADVRLGMLSLKWTLLKKWRP